MDHIHEITNNRLSSPGQCFDSNKTIFKTTSIVDNRPMKKNRNMDNLKANLSLNNVKNVPSSKPPEKLNNESNVFNGYSKIINDLIPYPSSSISTTIEKANNTNNNNRNNTNAKIVSNNKNKTNNKKFNKKFDNPNHSEQQSMVIQSITASQQLLDESLGANLCDGDLMKIVKTLIEKKETCTQTELKPNVNQYIQVNMFNDTDDPNIFDLRRSNQALRGQLEQLNYVIEEMSKERSNINLQIHSSQKLANVKQLKIDELNAERDKCLADNDELRFALKNYENLIHDYKNNLAIKNSENEHLNLECSQLNLDKTNLLSQIEQNKSELATKDTLINQLNNLNSLSQNEIESRSSQLAELNQQLNQTNLELQNLSHYKSNTEIELNQLRNQLKFYKSGQQQISVIPKTNLTNLKTNCFQLKDELNQLKNKLQFEKFDLLNHFNLIQREMCKQIENAFSQNNYHHQQQLGTSQQLRLELETQIQKLTLINEQLSLQKMQQIELMENENHNLKSELNQCKHEFNLIQETNNNLQRKFSALSTQYGELNQRNYEAKAQFEQCQTVVNKIQSELNERDQQSKSDAEQIDLLKEENCQLKDKVALFAKQSDLASEYQLEIEQLKELHQNLFEERKMERYSYEELVVQNENLKLELKSKQDKISNLNSNIQLLAKKYREFLQIKNESKSKMVDDKEQTSADGSGDIEEIESLIVDLNNLQASLEKKNILIQTQSDRLQELASELNVLNQDNKQIEEEKSLLEISLSEKDDQIVRLQNELDSKEVVQNSQLQLTSLNSDLTNEKNRSKGLSQSLFNEKRLNKKLKNELNELKQQLQSAKNDLIEKMAQHKVSPLSIIDQQQSTCQDDEEELKHELVKRIQQLKQLLLKSKLKQTNDESNQSDKLEQRTDDPTLVQTHSNQTESSDDNNPLIESGQSGDNNSSSQQSGDPTHSGDDFIIQILDQSEEIGNFDDPPLSKLHSSIEDLKQELNNLKKTFLES